MSCDERACPRCVPVHGRRTFASNVRETKWQYLISISYFRLPCLVWSPDHARDERFPFLGSDLSDSSRRRAAQSTSHPRLHTRLCGRRAGLWAPQSSQGVMRWWDSRLIHEPTTSADAVVVKRSPKPFSRAAASALSRRAVTVTTSAEVVDSSTGRLSHHCMTPCELWDAQSLVRRPHRLVRRFRCALEERLAMRRESARGGRFHDHGVGWGGRLMDQATVPPPHDTV